MRKQLRGCCWRSSKLWMPATLLALYMEVSLTWRLAPCRALVRGSCFRSPWHLPLADNSCAADVKPANFVLKLHHSRPSRALETGRGLQGSWLKAIDFGKPAQPGRQSSHAEADMQSCVPAQLYRHIAHL